MVDDYAKEGEKETSCGAIVIHDKKILFIKNRKFQMWGITKGHIQPGETEIACAKREVEEEAGIKDIKVIDDFVERVTYKNELFKTIKTVVLFIFTSKTDKVDFVDGENDGYQWLSAAEAGPFIEKMNSKKVVVSAVEFAQERGLL